MKVEKERAAERRTRKEAVRLDLKKFLPFEVTGDWGSANEEVMTSGLREGRGRRGWSSMQSSPREVASDFCLRALLLRPLGT